MKSLLCSVVLIATVITGAHTAMEKKASIDAPPPGVLADSYHGLAADDIAHLDDNKETNTATTKAADARDARFGSSSHRRQKEPFVGAKAKKGSQQHACMHDTAAVQRHMYTGMDHVVPQRGQTDWIRGGGSSEETVVKEDGNGGEEHRRGMERMSTSTTGSIRIVLRTEDLTNGNYCQNPWGTAPDFTGSSPACSEEEDVFNAAKRDTLINKVLPAAVAKLQEALSLTSMTENIVVPGQCGFHTIPVEDLTAGVPNADFILYVSAGKTPPNVLAWASYCYLAGSATGKGRPVIGMTNFGPASITVWNTTDEQAESNVMQVNTAVHEMIHALGFSKTFIESHFNTTEPTFVDTNSYRNGIPSRLVVTPKVVAETRDYFGCESAPGAELEWNEGSSGSHWNRRELYQELMSPVIGDSLLSRFTLALLEDSGYYTADYSKADSSMRWGRGRGCEFVTGACNTTGGGRGREFCSSTVNARGCTWDAKAVGVCQTHNADSPLPGYYRHFGPNYPNLGGSLSFFDHCPVVRGYDNLMCEDASITPTSTQLLFGYYFGANSRCLTVNGLLAYGYSGTSIDLRCMKVRCYNGTMVQYQVGSSPTWVSCPADGSPSVMSSPAGWSGTITCPVASAFCDDSLYYAPSVTAAPSTAIPATGSTPVPADTPTPLPSFSTACHLDITDYALKEETRHRLLFNFSDLTAFLAAEQQPLSACNLKLSCPAKSSGMVVKMTKWVSKESIAYLYVSNSASANSMVNWGRDFNLVTSATSVDIEAWGTSGYLALQATCLASGATVPANPLEVNHVTPPTGDDSAVASVLTSGSEYLNSIVVSSAATSGGRRAYASNEKKTFLISCETSDMVSKSTGTNVTTSGNMVAKLTAIKGSTGSGDKLTVFALDSSQTREFSGSLVDTTFAVNTAVASDTTSTFQASSQYYVSWAADAVSDDTSVTGITISYSCGQGSWSEEETFTTLSGASGLTVTLTLVGVAVSMALMAM